MIVTLAGFNVEKEILDRISAADPDTLTPEIFSAAYARISRSADDITTLRAKARKDVKKARLSNRSIIFEMGHHSVAEHAVFNFDIIGVSRLALEEIEQFRLVSYTEKSQRYVTLRGDYTIPREITEPEDREWFEKTVALQNAFYRKAYEILRNDLLQRHPAMASDRKQLKTLEGWAKEDARYILCLGTEGQVGLTINARNLEHLFRRFRNSSRAEVREIGDRMYEQVMKTAPSLILFADPSQFAIDLQDSFPGKLGELTEEGDRNGDAGLALPELLPGAGFRVIHMEPETDDAILAHALAVNQPMEYAAALRRVKALDYQKKEALYRELFKNLEFFDSLPRFFEMADMVFQARISASNFAQLKRHRIATLLTGDYLTSLGCVVPENIRRNNLEGEFRDIIGETDRVFGHLKSRYAAAADYILTNSHQRLVAMKMNLRECYHFVRLRADEHAQWDIRALALGLADEIRRRAPLAAMLLCGKSDYVRRYESLFQKKPRFLI